MSAKQQQTNEKPMAKFEQKHTPGPWSLEALRGDMPNGPWWVHANRVHIAENVGTYNALLIAAAPDMLAALKAIDPSWYEDDDVTNNQIRAAIAKAEGRS